MLGWALVYLPHLPGSFSYAPGLDPAVRSTVADALYLSPVVGATLGAVEMSEIVLAANPPAEITEMQDLLQSF